MIKEFVLNHMFMSSILLFGMLSLLLQTMMTLSLKGYVKASTNMKTTRKKVMINLKNQFETIYGMDYQMRNISAYVDKYLLKLRFLGLSYSAWEKVPFLTAGILTLLAGGGVFYEYMTNGVIATQIEILFSYGMVLVCLFVFFHIFGIKSKKQQIQIQLVDYLENYLTNRLTRTKEGHKELKLLDNDMEEAFMEGAAKNKELKQVILEGEKEEKQKKKRRKEDGRKAVQEKEPAISASDVDVEEDMDMLKRLIREIDSEQNAKQEEQIAVSEEMVVKSELCQMDSEEEEEEEGPKEAAFSKEEEAEEESEIELLEEFVQSFLA